MILSSFWLDAEIKFSFIDNWVGCCECFALAEVLDTVVGLGFGSPGRYFAVSALAGFGIPLYLFFSLLTIGIGFFEKNESVDIFVSEVRVCEGASLGLQSLSFDMMLSRVWTRYACSTALCSTSSMLILKYFDRFS